MSIVKTRFDWMLNRCWSDARSRARILLIALIAALMSLPSNALAQTTPTCGSEVKEEIVKSLASIDDAPDTQKAYLLDQLYKKYEYCGADYRYVGASFYAAAAQCGASISNLGSLFYEEMSCSGYDPQRRQFASPIKIKQNFGFGGSPLPGSREYVLHCVATPGGVLLPVGRDSVHLSNSAQPPTWQFAVITSATENLQLLQPMNGATRVARSILSWGFPPTGCNFQPIWGNALNYRIRLDQ